MLIEWDEAKEKTNIHKHGLDFSLAEHVMTDPLTAIVYDRHQDGEHRYHAIAVVGGACLVMVHTYPEPDNENRVRVIGLRQATPNERKRYEEGRDDT
jgi:uncharacterized DUF497 family protein